MHNTFFKNFLIAIIVLPTLSTAADVAPVVEPKAVAPVQTSVNSSQVTAAGQSTKIGYVDIARIGAESKRGETLRELLTKKKSNFKEKLTARKNRSRS